MTLLRSMQLHSEFPSIVESAQLPRLVNVGPSFHAAAFSLMKLLPARYILDQAAEAGEIGPSTTVIETTSGAFGLGLAMICRLRGYSLTIVSDPVIDGTVRDRLEDLGALVEVVREPASDGGFQRARLDRVRELQERTDDYFTPNQYDNPANAEAYGPVAEAIVETLGRIDCLVGAVGSGGSMCGTARFLRILYPELHLVGVDTPGSVLFGMDDRPRLVRGLGNSILPLNLDHTQFDEVHWVGAPAAFLATRHLYRDHCLFMGPTSGAAYLVARWWSERNPDACVVALLPDEGHRYQSTVYDDGWLREKDVLLAEEPHEPRLVDHPDEVGDAGWTRIQWARRTLATVRARENAG
jgi:cysteine synthase A